VWALGYTGQGVVVGGADTGYEWNHPALINQYRGWDGNTADHDYNWYDATAAHSLTPEDPFGHGTHTMGTMVGDDGGSNQIGMAPGARWIGCRNMDASGAGTPETYIACYQWFIAPTRVDGLSDPQPDLAPDVINNSWSCPESEGCTDPNVLLEAVQNVRAAGILTSHSAGNGGPECSTVRDPAAIYAESFTVGATDNADNLARFSSRGPVIVDDSNRPKPDISAPGVSIRSTYKGGTYVLMSGTSMAAPHVAGLVALLISVDPGLRGQVDALETAIEQSAKQISSTECSSTGVPNNLYGWGRIQALEAYQLLVPERIFLPMTLK
jgi:subtilisin family serine protease